MTRILYALCLVSLIGSTAWAATGLQSGRHESSAKVGIVILAALQR